ncbi:hypothetical protein CAP50_10335 [Psychrobacter sp. L7]|nr:hypothetical protein CAP50_10335 [Psychrobacter sp. L7]
MVSYSFLLLMATHDSCLVDYLIESQRGGLPDGVTKICAMVVVLKISQVFLKELMWFLGFAIKGLVASVFLISYVYD